MPQSQTIDDLGLNEWDAFPQVMTGRAYCLSFLTPKVPGPISPVFPKAWEGVHTQAEPPPAQLLWGQQG